MTQGLHHRRRRDRSQEPNTRVAVGQHLQYLALPDRLGVAGDAVDVEHTGSDADADGAHENRGAFQRINRPDARAEWSAVAPRRPRARPAVTPWRTARSSRWAPNSSGMSRTRSRMTIRRAQRTAPRSRAGAGRRGWTSRAPFPIARTASSARPRGRPPAESAPRLARPPSNAVAVHRHARSAY